MSDTVSAAPDNDEPAYFPRCGLCNWAIEMDKNMVICSVDLPPQLNVNPDLKRAVVHRNFVCGLYAERDTRLLRKTV